MSLREPLEEAIQRAIDNTEPTPPPNEATTVHWVILPLLHAAGYSLTDIVLESTAQTSQRPDLTLLPGAEHEWYVEAKAWGRSLVPDKHLLQACNYATNRGKRWVILTNGAVWRIYDAHFVQAAPADRLVAEARLDQMEDMVRILTEISKERMLGGGLVAFTARTRLAAHLTRALKDPESLEVEAVWKQVRKHPTFTGATRAAVAAYFEDLQPVPPPRPPDPTDPPAEGSPTAPETDIPPPPPWSHAEGDLQSLRDLDSRGAAVAGVRPRQVHFPDGASEKVRTSRDVACSLLEWLDVRNQLPPIPFTASTRGDHYFVNISATHPKRPMREPVTLILRGRTAYLEGNRSAQNFVRRLCMLCEGAGVSPDEVKIETERGG